MGLVINDNNFVVVGLIILGLACVVFLLGKLQNKLEKDFKKEQSQKLKA